MTSTPTPAPGDGSAARAVLADEVAAAVLAVPGVHSLHPGQFGEAATYLPGRRVEGVQLRESATHVHVVLDWSANIPATAERIREVVQHHVSTPVDVTVHDVVESPSPPLDQR